MTKKMIVNSEEPRHDIMLIAGNEAIGYGKVSYTQIMILDLSGIIKQYKNDTWKILESSSETIH